MTVAADAVADEHTAVVSFVEARLPLDVVHGSTAPISFALQPGDLALINAADPYHASILIEALCGLLVPRSGAVRFLDRDWRTLSDDAADALRGRIGHAFHGENWMDHLPLADNILMPQMYHNRRPLAALRAEASRLAEAFGLPGLPTCMPGEMLPADLQRAACVRAFLGSPDLVVLDNPTGGVYGEIVEPLVNATRRVRDRGGAVMWLTTERRVWSNVSIPASRRFRMRGNQLLEVPAIE
jgi:phospholipid/cholesterol/gamma-HCH transport system ATP-binding protein